MMSVTLWEISTCKIVQMILSIICLIAVLFFCGNVESRMCWFYKDIFRCILQNYRRTDKRAWAKFYLWLQAQMFCDTRKVMNSFDPYETFNINRILMLAIGLWPYQQSKLVQFQLILFSVILISFVTFQVYPTFSFFIT